MSAESMVGEECPVCHEEAFKFSEREVTVRTKCCNRCCRRIDLENADKTADEINAALNRSERRKLLKERSFQWASDLHGKKVIVYWYPGDGYSRSEHESQVQGTAYRTPTDECGGWGRVQVILDPSEHSRIDYTWDYRIECGTGKHLPYKRPRIDGEKWGLFLNKNDDGGYYVVISWGRRQEITATEKES